MKHLIISGSTKCATTSLYKYLCDHTDVSAAFTKETRYFLNESYPLKKPAFYRYEEGEYHSLFLSRDKKFYCEATPDYLYSKGTPRKIKKYLGSDVLVIFIFRDPVERFVSWYKYAKQIGEISESVRFEDFYKMQYLHGEGKKTAKKQSLMALEQGHYGRYLKDWRDEFDEENILILSMDELKDSPVGVLEKVCNKSGLSFDFFQNYHFSKENVGRKAYFPALGRLYFSLTRYLRSRLPRQRWVKSILRPARLRLERIVFKEREREVVSPEVLALLKSEYSEDSE